MNSILEQTLHYFRAKDHYFWRWAEGGNVIEWMDGRTICYRDEMISILRSINNGKGIPPIGTVLLTAAALQNSWNQSNQSRGIINGIGEYLVSQEFTSKEVLDYHIQGAFNCLETISRLPSDLKIGNKKEYVFYELFIGTGHQIDSSNGKMIIDAFTSGRLDEMIITKKEFLTDDDFKYDLKYLNTLGKRFFNVGILEQIIRTGVDKMPSALPIDDPVEREADLLTQLARDNKTEGIARLTKNVMAALHIPLHSIGSSDQPLGGISDITNKGNFDRLLLTELAQEDQVLTARLVNNEALYLKREEPPQNVHKQRIILIDATIKMWGTPRLFAAAAALSFSINVTKQISTSHYLLGGENYEEVDFSTKKGILHSLELLDSSLDFLTALRTCINDHKTKKTIEYVVISLNSNLDSKGFLNLIAQDKLSVYHIIKLTREGNLEYWEFKNGHSKLLSGAKFDLDELLFSKPEKSDSKEWDQNVPAFLHQNQSPLNFPSTTFKPNQKNSLFHTKIGIVGITDNHRLLYWQDKLKGAIELLHFVEKGEYFLTYDLISTVYLLIYNSSNQSHKIIIIDLSNNTIDEKIINKQIKSPIEISVDSNYLFIKTGSKTNQDPRELLSEVIQYDLNINEVKGTINYGSVNKIFEEKKFIAPGFNYNSLKKFINNGYSVLQRAKHIMIYDNSSIAIDNYYLHLSTYDLRWYEFSKDKDKLLPVQSPEIITLTSNDSIKFYKKTWQDGSVAIVDSRGFLHLKSSDTSIPEMTFILVIEKGSACWSSNGDIAGSIYFTNRPQPKTDPTLKKFREWLKNFIERLGQDAITI